MTDNEIVHTVNTCLSEEFELEAEALVPTARIREDLGLDSLDIVDLVVLLEQAFDFKLPNREELAKITQLGDIYNYIAKLRDSGTDGEH